MALYEDFDEEFGVNGPGGAMDELSVSVASSGTSPGVLGQLQQLQREELAARGEARNYRRQLFEQGRAALEARRMGPSRAEQLFALSAAFAAPQRYKGFGGMMANVAPTLAGIAGATRESKEDYASQLQKLQQQYMSGEIDDRQSGINSQRQMLQTLASLEKQPKRRTGFNPITGELVDMETNAPIGEGGGDEALPLITSPDDARKLPPGTSFRTPDGRIMQVPGGGGGNAPGGFQP